MEVMLIPVVLIGLVLYVAWPLMEEDDGEPVTVEEMTELDRALEVKESALANLKDIEMDFRMGKLSQEDYERLKEDWEARAVAAMQNVEALEQKPKRKKS
jgi:hypothetical protein